MYSEKSELVGSVSVREVFDQKGFKDGNKIEINVGNLPRGGYYFHLFFAGNAAGKPEQTRIILE